jgi:hypothetical protein
MAVGQSEARAKNRPGIYHLAEVDSYRRVRGSLGRKFREAQEAEPMRLWLWVAFFVVSNVLGVEVFKAAMTLPWDEAFLPGLLTVPLVGLSALGATRIVSAWQQPEE